MKLMNLDLDGVLTVEKAKVLADRILHLSHDLFKPLPLKVSYNGKELTRGQDYIPYAPDERLYYQKNVTLFTTLKILNDELLDKELDVEYFACGDYIDANTWNDYPTADDLKLSLESKVDNADFINQVNRIDSEIATETEARTAADSTLQENIDAEKSLREAADAEIQSDLEHEAELRKAADSTLQANIDAEKSLREAADAELQDNIEHEAELRKAADSTLQANIDAEKSLREAADAEIQSQVTDLKTKFDSFVPGLTYKVVEQLPATEILSDVIYLVPTESVAEHQVYEEYLYINGDWELIGTTATTQAITVDSALSATSTNPVQNKVVQQALSNKLDETATEFAGNSATATSLQYKGENGWTTETDTPANWIKKGTCSWYFKKKEQLNGQPTQYGVVLNLVTTLDVRQLFFCCALGDGRIYQRGGTARDGWHANGWHKVIDTACLINSLTSTSTTDALTAAQGKALNEKFGSYLPLAGGKLTGNVTIEGMLYANGGISIVGKDFPNAIATQSAAGLMSAEDKKKLDTLKYHGNGPLTVATLSGYEAMILCCNRYNGGYLSIRNADNDDSINGKVYVNNAEYAGTIPLTKGRYYVIIVTEEIRVEVRLISNGGGAFSAIRI